MVESLYNSFFLVFLIGLGLGIGWITAHRLYSGLDYLAGKLRSK